MAHTRKTEKVRITNTRPFTSVIRNWCAEHPNRADICKATGISAASMSQFIQGKRSVSAANLDKIARFFGVKGKDVNGLPHSKGQENGSE